MIGLLRGFLAVVDHHTQPPSHGRREIAAARAEQIRELRRNLDRQRRARLAQGPDNNPRGAS